MKFTTAILAAVALMGLASATGSDDGNKCNRDNCFRGVLGTNGKKPLSVRKEECAENLKCTKIEGAHVETKTVTYKHGTTTIHVRKETHPPKHIPGPTSTCGSGPAPDYANCAGNGENKQQAFARYSSACSCGGITASTKHVPGPTVTATVKVIQPYVEYKYD